MSAQTVLTANDLTRYYPVAQGMFKPPAILKALDGASFTLTHGKTLAIVGESGCGKSTLARLVTMIEPPTSGMLEISDTQITSSSSSVPAGLRPKVQIVFQDPYGSLNPRQRIGNALEEPLMVNGLFDRNERTRKARAMMEKVGLRPEYYDRYPHMFSGGQRQRIAVARALMLEPDILVLDEPVSALDLSIQAQVLNLLTELQEKLSLSYLFISHDLSVVRYIADEIMVMYLGRPVEQGSADIIFKDPQHPYTKALLSATPIADPARKKQRTILTGELPSPIAPPRGCAFNPRCPLADELCRKQQPALENTQNRLVACHAVQDTALSPSRL